MPVTVGLRVDFSTTFPCYAAVMGIGAGEFPGAALGTLCISTSGSWLLLSLLTWLFSGLFSLLLPLAEADAVPSAPASSGFGLGGAVHRGISQMVPVKLLSVKPPLAHFRHGLPDRSRARRPALIAPWLALGPRRWPAPRPPALPSAVPSSLW